jgi:spore germination cell wall hydrolase CwlJ-like protein
MKVSAGVAALAVSLVSVLAPVEAQNAFAQVAPVAQHTQPAANEVVPQFLTREIVQPLPASEDTDAEQAQAPIGADSLEELVARMPRDAKLNEELECLAGAVYFEARGEPLQGQLAVAEVIINRAASGRFPASYCGVVMQKAQFSFVKRGRMPAAPRHSETYRKAAAIAQIAHRGLWDSAAKDALYFHARHVSPAWSGRRQAAARIHNHVFYR